MSFYDIAGAEDFEELGGELAGIVSPDEWLNADEPERRLIAQRINRFIRMRNELEHAALEFADLPPATYGEYHQWQDLIKINKLLLLEDDPSALVATVAHENRHAFQSAVLEGVVEYPHGVDAVGEVELWRQAEENYDSDDLVAYMYSPLETDARAAEAGVLVGFWKSAYERLAEDLDD